MMTRLSPIAMCALGVLTFSACGESASTSVAFESRVSPLRSLVIKNTDGQVKVRAGRPGSRVEGHMAVWATGFDTVALATEALNDVALVERGSTLDLILEVAAPDVPGFAGYDVGLELVVPADVAVTIIGGNDPVALADVGVARVETQGGAVSLTRTYGDASLNAHGGALEVQGHEGDLEALTMGAPITLEGIYGEVFAKTTLAPIHAEVIPPPGASLSFSTVEAPIEVLLPQRFPAALRASTTAPGLVVMDGLDFFPVPSAPGEVAGDLGRQTGYVGNLDVRTTNADIHLVGTY